MVSRVVSMLAASLTVGAAFAASAGAHAIKVSEVAGGEGTSYVELQFFDDQWQWCWAPCTGPPIQVGAFVTIRDATGTEIYRYTFASEIANKGSQSFVLLADSPTVDGVMADFVDPNLDISGLAPGAVCFENIDCVSWGAGFTGEAALPKPAGNPAPLFADGVSLTRSIARGDPTKLEFEPPPNDPIDDTDNSAVDFYCGPRNPSNNDTLTPPPPYPSSDCGVSDPGPTSPGPDTTPPETWILKAPRALARSRIAKLRFVSSEVSASFWCSRDGKPYRACSSPLVYRHLKPGRHVVKILTTDAAGNVDPSPAKHRWRISQARSTGERTRP